MRQAPLDGGVVHDRVVNPAAGTRSGTFEAVDPVSGEGIRSILRNYVRGGGTVVMDANDIGRNVLGADVAQPWDRYEEMFADNPLGQGSEQTPMAIVFEQP